MLAQAAGSTAARSSTEITLYTSGRDGVVGLVDGANWRWAHTAMELAGFEKTADGNKAVSLSDPDRAREVLLTLGVVAQLAGVTVHASSETYVGDFARDIVEHLPGRWTVSVENYAMKVWQGDLADCLWNTGHVASTLANHRVARAAILRRDDGAELAVLRDPRRDLHHVGALHPRDIAPDGLVTPPPGVTVQPTPSTAADVIRTRLLPAYTRAVLHCRVNSLEEDLPWTREAYEAGTIPEPPPADLVDSFARFTTAAPHVTAAVRALVQLNEHEVAVLREVDDIIGAPDADTKAPPALPHDDPLAWWLLEGGEGLIDLAQRAVADSEPHAAKASRALPSPPALPPAPARASTPAPRP
ncbi:hypothetical protein BJP40_03810 [Streptomyces sp. CC53]|uniref:hypothetical protein n=1 Tax=Streptomyces sp. CC53 TaxID=1906740 RepID=UPI0008DCF213|nr:hypothetical protein [Streptomyces sp. CC53]OII62139.1 hypothetical protein BJP40_03810 [Streptomyces sp. CC53]